MNVLGRLIAATVTAGFLVLAIPFLALTANYMHSGGAIGGNTLLVVVTYIVGIIAVIVFWIRRFRSST
jgi:hypothetical protein